MHDKENMYKSNPRKVKRKMLYYVLRGRRLQISQRGNARKCEIPKPCLTQGKLETAWTYQTPLKRIRDLLIHIERANKRPSYPFYPPYHTLGNLSTLNLEMFS
jgi:hypothetical protein